MYHSGRKAGYLFWRITYAIYENKKVAAVENIITRLISTKGPLFFTFLYYHPDAVFYRA